MRPKDFLRLVKEQATYHAETLVERDIPPPKGWFTVDQIREELRMAHTRNASSRALDLHRRGLLERQPHQFKAKTGQCHMAYVYRPVPPYRTIAEAATRAFEHQEETVPKGWVRIVDVAGQLQLSAGQASSPSTSRPAAASSASTATPTTLRAPSWPSSVKRFDAGHPRPHPSPPLFS